MSLRLDKYVSDHSQVSRKTSQNLIKSRLVKVNKEVVIKPDFIVKDNDKVDIGSIKSPAPIKKLNIEVIYEDKDCVVINKPIGVLSHAKGEVLEESSVASWLSARYKGEISNRSGIVHRLDRSTSGVMICAKNAEATLWLQKQFSSRKVKKNYIAVALGHFKNSHALIDMPIERNPKKPSTFRAGANGKPAQTEYLVEKENKDYSLVKLVPLTGRTHQIRVHLAKIGHPILGDLVYGKTEADRVYLHAEMLEITLPSKVRKVFEVKPPKSFYNIFK